MFKIKIVNTDTGEVVKEERIHTDAHGNLHHLTMTKKESRLDEPLTWPTSRVAIVVTPGNYRPAEDADLEALGWTRTQTPTDALG